MPTEPSPLHYEQAGVSIDQGNAFVSALKPLAQSTHTHHVLQGIGGFAGCFALPTGYQKPVLVASTDGVGTKLKIAQAMNQHEGIGIDVVAMCVNDIIVTGAKPLFFLDYYACGALDPAVGLEIIRGIQKACHLTGMALLGGETAEMPGIYHAAEYDVAGFCVGVVEADHLVQPQSIQPGDQLLGLPSSGIHANGFSLVRKILETHHIPLDAHVHPALNQPLGEILLTPTHLYTAPLVELIHSQQIRAAAHITGGGLQDNLARIIPDTLCARVNLSEYSLPPIFDFLQKKGPIQTSELWRTFNCGIGMVLIVPPHALAPVLTRYHTTRLTPMRLGEITPRNAGDSAVMIQGLESQS
jgi:phosphoribosylformylglycinamidine cyclo-ligase